MTEGPEAGEGDGTGPRVVVTGGPGAGKSTLIDRLQEAGFARSHEAGRGVIRDQMSIGGRALPWADRELFAELMLGWELRSYRTASAAPPTASAEGATDTVDEDGATRTPVATPVFFDRGIPDIVGYLRLEGLPVPEHVHAAALRFRYHRSVFVAPPWPEIYRRDAERRQSYEEAERTYESMVATYTEYGYEPVTLPRAPVEERVRFVIERLRRA
ncbi:AAA family ATPase [Streptosporangium sandarakinum]|uniref:AAA family ATPase n=1 Tax=Streptosporangium sandarakinum TaxID=1260955 RepID=UPI00344A35AD